MGLLLIFVAVYIVASIILRPPEANSPYTGKSKKTFCPPHEWAYNEAGFLQCKLCNNKPGYEARE